MMPGRKTRRVKPAGSPSLSPPAHGLAAFLCIERLRMRLIGQIGVKAFMHPRAIPCLLLVTASAYGHILEAAPSGERFAETTTGRSGPLPAQATVFKSFPRLKLSSNERFLLVGSDGMPDHPMMIGITSWQQQVPLPQAYFGSNAWQVPLRPVPAPAPIPLHNRFLRGAVALAVNGVPIFNPQNNRGEVSQDIGELDKWGGHCGRGDDYHYHIIPLHLQSVVGKAQPVAYALDGYPIYGTTEPDGSAMRPLDVCGGHEDAKLGYHYHGTGKSPYVFTAFRGVVTEVEGQVDPQPRATPVREATAPLRGAVITGFSAEVSPLPAWKLTYTVSGEVRTVRYVVSGTSVRFDFDNGKAGKTSATYERREGRQGKPSGGGKGGEERRPPRQER